MRKEIFIISFLSGFKQIKLRSGTWRKRLRCASDIVIRCSTLGVQPARNALIAVGSQVSHLIYMLRLALTKYDMRGRRVFDVHLLEKLLSTHDSKHITK